MMLSTGGWWHSNIWRQNWYKKRACREKYCIVIRISQRWKYMAPYHTQNCLDKVRILLNGCPNFAVIFLFRTVRVKCELHEILHLFWEYLLHSQSQIFKERNLSHNYFASYSNIFSLWMKPAAIYVAQKPEFSLRPAKYLQRLRT